MKKLLALAIGVVCLSARAEYDESDGYVRLNYSDQPFSGSDSHTSWDQCWTNPKGVPAWSDGQAPHSTTNYYIPAGRFVCMNNGIGGKIFGDGDGAKLVLAGYLQSRHSSSEMTRLPWFRELELLSGSYFYNDWSCHGLQKTRATVLASADNPFECRAKDAGGGYDGCYYFVDSEFVGGADTGVRFKTLDTAAKEFNTFYLEAKTFASYPGTFTATGAKTKVTAYSGNNKGGLNFAGTAVIENGAVLQGAINKTNWTSYPTATFGSLELRTGAKYAMWIENGVARPLVEATKGFRIDDTAKVVLGNFAAGLPAATVADDPDLSEMRIVIAHLTGDAVSNYSLPEGKVCPTDLVNAESSSLFADWEYEVVDDGNGGKNVCLVHRRRIVKTLKGDNYKNNDECAFGNGDPANFWSDGVKPTGDAAVDCVMPFFWANIATPIDLPNATLTFSSSDAYLMTSMGRLRARELNLIGGCGVSSWNSYAGSQSIVFEVEKINLLGTAAVTFNISHGEVYDLAGVTGVAPLFLNDRGVKWQSPDKTYNNPVPQGIVNLRGDNSDYHGRLTIRNKALPLLSDTDDMCFKTFLGQAKSWGGAFTADADAYSAITFQGSPYVVVTNDVTFGSADRSMYVTGGVRFNVTAGKTLKLANLLTDYGPIVKLGDGTLELAGVMDVRHDDAGDALRTNVVRVLKGALKIGSKTACDGMDVTFAEGTKLVIAEGCTDGFYNVASTQPLAINTASGKLPVEIERTEKPEDDTEVVVCTLNAAAAEGLTAENFAIVQTRACRVASFEKRTLGDGNVAFVATLLGKKGLVLLAR